MASSTLSPVLLQSHALHCVRNAPSPSCCKAQAPKPAPKSVINRRQLLFFITAAPALRAGESASFAQDIPLFGLRKKLKKVEEEAEELVREGFETAEKGVVTVERGIETAEKSIEGAEREIEAAVGFGGLAQASAVAGAELVGVLVATSIVNGILGAEGS